MARKPEFLDTTLRDGRQNGGRCDLDDILRIAKALDSLGAFKYFEAGIAVPSRKLDLEFFKRIPDLRLSMIPVVFGFTGKKCVKPENDPLVRCLIKTGIEHVTLVGKTSAFHAKNDISATKNQNLYMIRDTIGLLVKEGRKVFFDAEHFFYGWKFDPDYSLRCLSVAVEAGASLIVLCDTTGGMLPRQIQEAVRAVNKKLGSFPLGFHAHNDVDLAVANTMVAWEAGVGHLQCTLNGDGERSGNARGTSLIPNFQLKLGIPVTAPEKLALLKAVSHIVSDHMYAGRDRKQPFVGDMAFMHHGGVHIDAVLRNSRSYNHVQPDDVGNQTKIGTSDMSGKAMIKQRLHSLGIEADKEMVTRCLEKFQEQSQKGKDFGRAHTSLNALLLRETGKLMRQFTVHSFSAADYQVLDGSEENPATATVHVYVNGETKPRIKTAQGSGILSALDNALKSCLIIGPNGSICPFKILEKVRLKNYFDKSLGITEGTDDVVRIIIVFECELKSGEVVELVTCGVSTHANRAGFEAILDCYHYLLWMVM